MEHLRRYSFFWRLLRPPVRRWLQWKFHLDAEVCTEEGPFLVLCNHNLDWDPLLLACAFPNYMSYVASEHIFRWGLAAKLIIFFMNPIARLKGKTAGDTAMTMLRRLRKGVSVAMFAEGNRSFNGLTGEILPATGKLARSSGVKLITYCFDGGYLTSPRWCGKGLRRGRMIGRVKGVYTPQELKAMSADEVNAVIRRDLFVDAYAAQRADPVAYRGRRLAEHLETVLCRCPRCGGLDTLHSDNDMLRCDCGLSVRYNEFGFLEGEGLPYDNVTDWDEDQTVALCAMADAAEGAIFSDSDMELSEILPDVHKAKVLGSGSMTLYPDRLECCGQVFPLTGFGGFSLHGPQTVNMSCDGRSFEIRSSKVCCTRKYMTVINHLMQNRD